MYCLYVGVDYTYIDVKHWHRGLNPFWPHMFGFKPLLGLEPMAPIRPQLLVSHANHSATKTSICMYESLYVCVCVYIYIIFLFFFKQSCEAPPVDFTAPYWGAHPPHGDSAPHVPRHPRHQRNRYHSPPGHEADDSGLGTAAAYNYTAFSQRKLTHSSNINYCFLASLV